jgi:hypothetical protein
LTPVVGYGAQSRLQHPLQASQTVPSTPSLQYVGPEGGGAHLPAVAPDEMSQMPPQQSTEFEQMSPVWMHQPGVRAHVPLLQYLEQQSSLAPQALPAVLQDVLMGVQVPFVQVPLQQAPFVVQAWLSEMQLPPQTPPLQLSEQQSVPEAHAAPDARHLPATPTVDAQVPVAASHDPEQHCPPPWQTLPVAPHVAPTLASPERPKGPVVEPPQLTTRHAKANSQVQRAIIQDLRS